MSTVFYIIATVWFSTLAVWLMYDSQKFAERVAAIHDHYSVNQSIPILVMLDAIVNDMWPEREYVFLVNGVDPKTEIIVIGKLLPYIKDNRTRVLLPDDTVVELPRLVRGEPRPSNRYGKIMFNVQRTVLKLALV